MHWGNGCLNNFSQFLPRGLPIMEHPHDAPARPASPAPESEKVAEGARHELVQQALNQYHICKDGTVVTNPADCLKVKGFPELDIHHHA
jgi:hypothetical protein